MTSTCKECKGTGEYKVFNAYDPEYEEIVTCEYCNGASGSALPGYKEVKGCARNWVN